MKIKITVTIPGNKPFAMHAEVKESGDTANAIREALDEARRLYPGCSIFNCNIKLESRENAQGPKGEKRPADVIGAA